MLWRIYENSITWIYATSLLMSIKSRKPEEHDNCSQKNYSVVQIFTALSLKTAE